MHKYIPIMYFVAKPLWGVAKYPCGRMPSIIQLIS